MNFSDGSSRKKLSPSLKKSSAIEYESAKKCRARVESMTSLHLDPSLVKPFESEPVRVLKSQARSSPCLDSSSILEYKSARKCQVRVESWLGPITTKKCFLLGFVPVFCLYVVKQIQVTYTYWKYIHAYLVPTSNSQSQRNKEETWYVM